jgi:hypothetical protein
VIDLGERQHGERAGLARRIGELFVLAFEQEDHRRETGTSGELREPGKTVATLPRLGEQHGVVALRQKSGLQCAANHRIEIDDVRVRPHARQVVTYERAVTRIVIDKQDSHRRITSCGRRGDHLVAGQTALPLPKP